MLRKWPVWQTGGWQQECMVQAAVLAARAEGDARPMWGTVWLQKDWQQCVPLCDAGAGGVFYMQVALAAGSAAAVSLQDHFRALAPGSLLEGGPDCRHGGGNGTPRSLAAIKPHLGKAKTLMLICCLLHSAAYFL